ncbi:MAG: agmatinase, partial [Gemmatimonadaceae bacterium]
RAGGSYSVSTPTLLGLPYDAASSFMRGAAAGPAKIREALHSPAGNSWTEALVDLGAAGVLQDAGDVRFSESDDALLAIETAVERILANGGRPISLGGDHGVTYPIIRALRRYHPQLSILHIDAHGDLYDEFDGNRYSHACAFARIMEAGLADRLVQVGIRTMTGHQRAQAHRFGVVVSDMRAWYSGERPSVDGPVYLSIDLDGIDPAFAPGVGHPEPGGLSVRDVIAMVQSVAGPLVGADIVELNPNVDPNDATARVAAKLVKEVVARMHTNNLP